MSQQVKAAQASCRKALESLRALGDKLPLDEVEELRRRVQRVYNTLVENERRVWLWSREGKDLSSRVQEASSSLEEALMQTGAATDIEARLETLEKLVDRLREEVAKRQAVVT